jgi:hypothetical protein
MCIFTPDDDRIGSQTRFCHAQKSSRLPTEAALEGQMVQGQCLCGKVRFEVSGHLGSTRLCYCELCRRANGSAFSANVRVPASSYKLLSGAGLIREYESSPGAFRAFCSFCGSPVYARVISDPDHTRVRLGTLDTGASAIVAAHVWVRSKPHWYEITDEMPQYEQAAPRKLGP